jgi:hypothetical protein
VEKIPVEAVEVSSKESQKHVLLNWEAPEYIKHPKGQLWFMIAGALIVLLVLYAIWTNSWTMAVAFIVFAGVYSITHHKEPGNIRIEVDGFGITVAGRRIPYNRIKTFWIISRPPVVNVLKLLLTEKFMGEMSIQLGDQDPGEVRTILIRHIPEYEGRGESFVDFIIRSFKL